jgi:hypothetical protein
MKRTLIISALVLVVAFPVVLASPPSGPVMDPEISAILSNVDANRIFNTAQAPQNFRTRQSCSDQPEPGHGVTLRISPRPMRRALRK